MLMIGQCTDRSWIFNSKGGCRYRAEGDGEGAVEESG